MANENEGLLSSPRVAQFAVVFLGIAVAFLAVQMLVELMNVNAPTQIQQPTISVSGEGKSSATPDLATVSFTVSEDAATVSAAQAAVAKNATAALAALKGFSIADKDIQTSSYNVYPKYSTQQPCVYGGVYGGTSVSSSAGGVISSMPMLPCPASESKIIGYTSSESVTVKVRNLDTVGDIMTALGKANVSNLSGPNFTVENPDAVQASARTLAIADAKAKAEMLAKDLGVRLVRVVSYNEGGGYYAPRAMGVSAMDSSAKVSLPIPVGENEVTIDVSVTYEIR